MSGPEKRTYLRYALAAGIVLAMSCMLNLTILGIPVEGAGEFVLSSLFALSGLVLAIFRRRKLSLLAIGLAVILLVLGILYARTSTLPFYF
jgi:hypothetical protein